MRQTELFSQVEIGSNSTAEKKRKRAGAFVDNMQKPIHRWFRYSAGFQAEWVAECLGALSQDKMVLDPFAGSGTTVLAANEVGLRAVGFESHPFVYRIGCAKLGWDADVEKLRGNSKRILSRAQQLESRPKGLANELLVRCFTADSLSALMAMRTAYQETDFEDDKIANLVWLAITSILRDCSHVGTAQWQYILPEKTKRKKKSPWAAFLGKIDEMVRDMEIAQSTFVGGYSEILSTDARHRSPIPDESIDVVITSPPYPNNYDYADATRLEMTFWGEVDSWGDLHQRVRKHLIRSCSQHSAADKLQLLEILADKTLDPIRSEIEEVCAALALMREQRNGKKTYHTMIAAYFVDLARVWSELARVCKRGSELRFIIGDSAPYGIHVPVDRWFGSLAIAAGFREWKFEKTRDRNVKWKNRKHRVPLQEGCLFVVK